MSSASPISLPSSYEDYEEEEAHYRWFQWSQARDALPRPSLSATPDPTGTVCASCWENCFSTETFKEWCKNTTESSAEFQLGGHSWSRSAKDGCSLCAFLFYGEYNYQPDDDDDESIKNVTLKFQQASSHELPMQQVTWFQMTLRSEELVTLAVDPNDPAAAAISTCLTNPVVDSPAISKDIKQWFQECESHKECPPLKTRPLPKRVIDVGTGSGMDIRLEETGFRDDVYAALSYCWGGGQVGKTTRANVKARLDSLGLRELSATVRDAVHVARQASIRYLWVDAICIIQDDPDDLVSELVNMANIYRNAAVTIVASSASSSNDGFLQPREPWDVKLFRMPFWNPGTSTVGTVWVLRKRAYDERAEPISSRGWTYQERILSPRCLFYHSHTLQWQCASRISSLDEAYRIVVEDRYIPDLNRRLLDPRTGAASHDVTTALSDWARVISSFSAREVSSADDRLRAIAAVAESFAPSFTSVGGTYLAGLWGGDVLPWMLLWCMWKPRYTRRLSGAEYVAPTWSWASVSGGAMYHFSTSRGTQRHLAQYEQGWFLTRLLNVSTTLRNPSLPYGSITGGVLELQAYTRRAKVRARPYNDAENREHDGYFTWESERRGMSMGSVWVDLGVHYNKNFDALCVLIHHNKYVRRILGLLVVPVGESDGVYERVGMWNTINHTSDGRDFIEHELECWDQRIIQIV